MLTIQTAVRLSVKNILFPTDFSVASEAALPYATTLAQWYGSKVTIAHVVPPERVMMPMEPMPPDANFEWINAERKMSAFSVKHRLADTKHETVLEEGDRWETIARIIERNEIDLLVLGTHGRQGLAKMVMGSAAEEIFRRASCPVLTVGPKAAREPGQFENWKQILYATDYSEGSLQALPYALSLAEENEATLTLLHLVPLIPLEERDDIERAMTQRLQALVPADASQWCNLNYVVRFDFPAEGILQVAEERHVDVIVMGVHKSERPRRTAHLPWAIAHTVVCNAHSPVLTVRG